MSCVWFLGCVWLCGRCAVAGVAPYVVGFTVACVRMAVCVCGGVAPYVCGREKKGGARGGPPLCGVQAAVSYSPTPWRVQYHRRWQS